MITDITQPTILVSGQITENTASGALEGTASVQAMLQHLRSKGINAQMVDHRNYCDPETGELLTNKLQTDLKAADGLVIMGNDQDVDPSAYNETPDPNTKSEIHPDSYRAVPGQWSSPDEQVNYEMGVRRSQWEMAATQEALDMSMPVLGICAGMQRINIIGMKNRAGHGRKGGNLHQHIDGMWQEEAMDTPVKYITIEGGSRLGNMAAELPSERADHEGSWIKVNSRHHQAIKTLADGFKATAHCMDDGANKQTRTVQGIELDSPHHFVMGVQWHPETMTEHPLSQKIFEGIADAARDRMEAKAAGAGNHALLALASKGTGAEVRIA